MNYCKEYGLPTCSIRPFNIYGPRQVGEGAIHHFIRRAIAGEPVTVHNDGSQIRAWCYIDDIIEAILLALAKEEAVGHAFNIGNPRSTVTIHHLAREIIRLSSSSSSIELVDWPHADVEIRVPAVGKAQERLGYRAQVDLEEGLLRTIQWYRRNRRP
jgi:nucleoside-diphosphate-sugar epimerase